MKIQGLDKVLSLLMKGYVIEMVDTSKLLSLTFISILLIASYGYVTGEASDAATLDPTHTGKAFIAEVLPLFWLLLIMLSLGTTAYVAMEDVI